MHATPILFPFLLPILCGSCGATRAGAADPNPPEARAEGETIGVFAPRDAEAFRFWPAVHAGSLLVHEILPQGTMVTEGDVLVRLDERAIDAELQRAELEARSSRVSHETLLAKSQLEDEAARAALERARAALARARRALDGWKERELAHARRADEISKRYEEANIEDQTDELDQLTKMYQADELVDATEDIVIKRSRRQLALSQTQNELARDRARYREELELALQTEQREEDFRAQAEVLARLEATQALEARQREDAAARSAGALAESELRLEHLRQDRELFVVKAWRGGIFLHGGPEEYRPGKNPARYRRGDTLPLRSSVFTIADPEPSAVALELSDASLTRFADGARVVARPVVTAEGAADDAVPGRLHVDAYARSLSKTELSFEANVMLDRPLAGVRYGARARVELAEE